MARRIWRYNSPRDRRRVRVRGKVNGTPQRPRLSVFRSATHIYAQVIDDAIGHTLASASSVESQLRERKNGGAKVDVAKQVGLLVGERALGAGVSQVVFDRGGYRYHGRVKALADGAREGGLSF
jgi:large subunit ribosomal protein L18